MESKSCFFRGSIPQIIHLGFFRGLVYIFTISDLYSFFNRHIPSTVVMNSGKFRIPGVFTWKCQFTISVGIKKNQPSHFQKIGITISGGGEFKQLPVELGGLWKILGGIEAWENSWIQQVMGGDPPDWPIRLPETNSETGTYTFFLTGRSLEDEFLFWGFGLFSRCKPLVSVRVNIFWRWRNPNLPFPLYIWRQAPRQTNISDDYRSTPGSKYVGNWKMREFLFQ